MECPRSATRRKQRSERIRILRHRQGLPYRQGLKIPDLQAKVIIEPHYQIPRKCIRRRDVNDLGVIEEHVLVRSRNTR